jgi:hypothetical protein
MSLRLQPCSVAGSTSIAEAQIGLEAADLRSNSARHNLIGRGLLARLGLAAILRSNLKRVKGYAESTARKRGPKA